MEKINIAELLKDCPKGMELDCAMYEDVTFEGVEDVGYTEILVKTPSGQIRLTKEGCFTHNDKYAKCVIFPKGKTTWEGFHRPFEDGDVVVAGDDESFQLFLLKHLTHIKDDNSYDGYCYFGWDFQCNELFEEGKWGFNRLATEEEKAKLFQAIKDNGYKWNAETKILEKLPKFKVGDKITKIDGSRKGEIFYIDVDKYHVAISNIIGIDVFFEDQDDWELVPDIKPKFKVWNTIKNKNDNTIHTINYIYNDSYGLCDGHILFFKEQDQYELVPNKFDITTLKPFESRVLVRFGENSLWKPAIFGFYNKIDFYTVGGIVCAHCIPYEGNEHLLGTTDDCDEYFKTWE